MLTVAELIRYRMQNERYVHRIGEAMYRRATGFPHDRLRERGGWRSHVALVMGELPASITAEDPMLVRMHAHCLVGDVFGAASCELPCDDRQIDADDRRRGRGAIIYLHQSTKGFTVEKVGR